MSRCDITNYRPASRGAESISKETVFFKICYIYLNINIDKIGRPRGGGGRYFGIKRIGMTVGNPRKLP